MQKESEVFQQLQAAIASDRGRGLNMPWYVGLGLVVCFIWGYGVIVSQKPLLVNNLDIYPPQPLTVKDLDFRTLGARPIIELKGRAVCTREQLNDLQDDPLGATLYFKDGSTMRFTADSRQIQCGVDNDIDLRAVQDVPRFKMMQSLSVTAPIPFHEVDLLWHGY